MNNILEFIPYLKIIYLILIILIMVIINIILNKKNISTNYKYLINGVVLVLLGLMVNNFADIVDGIFNLNYLSVKLYLVTLIAVNIITILSIHKKYELIYRCLNYLLFGLTAIILIANIVIVGNSTLNIFKFDFGISPVNLVNISIVIFIIYLTILSIIYVVRNIKYKNIVKIEENTNGSNKINLKEFISNKIELINNKKNKLFNKEEISYNSKRLSLEELLALPDKKYFSINGVDCSIIFDDSIPANILRNYNILSDDIHARMVNGYTLEENKMLKSICLKLETTNFDNIDLNNLTILNKISPEEYDLLKQICGN